MQQIKLLCRMQVLPLATEPGADGSVDEHAKQLVFEDDDTGMVIVYPMGGEMSKRIGGKLKMNNKALADTIEKEQADALARATITGGATPNGPGVLGPGGGPIGG